MSSLRLEHTIPINLYFLYQNTHIQMFTFRFKYIVVLDIDEVIVPKKHDSWSAMMAEVLKHSAKEPKTISWHFRHTYFIDSMTEEHFNDSMKMEKMEDGPESNVEKNNVRPSLPASDIPHHLHMLSHIFRSAIHSKGKGCLCSPKWINFRGNSKGKEADNLRSKKLHCKFSYILGLVFD